MDLLSFKSCQLIYNDLCLYFQFPICKLEHLKNKTHEYHNKLLALGTEEPVLRVEEFGLNRIREILAGFQSTQTKQRCDCQLPCSRKFFTVQSWRSDAKNKNELASGQKNGFAFFQVSDVSYYPNCLHLQSQKSVVDCKS